MDWYRKTASHSVISAARSAAHALKLGQCAHQMKNELAMRCGYVNLLRQADEIGSPTIEEIERLLRCWLYLHASGPGGGSARL